MGSCDHVSCLGLYWNTSLAVSVLPVYSPPQWMVLPILTVWCADIAAGRSATHLCLSLECGCMKLQRLGDRGTRYQTWAQGVHKSVRIMINTVAMVTIMWIQFVSHYTSQVVAKKNNKNVQSASYLCSYILFTDKSGFISSARWFYALFISR